MSKSTPSPPAAPDPAKTAAAQTQSNQETALYNFGLNNPNVNTPLGSQSYSVNTAPTVDQAGFDKAMAAYNAGGGATPQTYEQWADGQRAENSMFSDAGRYRESAQKAYAKSNATNKGTMPTIDQFTTANKNPSVTQNITLSPEQQQLYDLSTSQSIDLSKLASMLQGSVGDSLKQPTPGDADFNAQAQKAQEAYYANQTRMLDPQWQQAQEQLDAKLANQGLTIGGEAYNNENNNFARQKQSAYDTAQNNAIRQGPQNAQQLFSLSSAARQQPLNEFNALRSQSQVQMPSFQQTTPAMSAPTDVAGLYQNQYQGQMNAYNQQVASNNSATGGLFSLAGAGLGAYGTYAGLSALGPAAVVASDIRLKENILLVGEERGLPIYHFNYKSDPEKLMYRGVMAQDVLHVLPQAVIDDGMYMAVNYGMLGIEFARVH